ncbi:MAG TPA: hypothetical protein VLG50_07455 [Candidatus Saccharimonadales bacterium]|nr:hypothetical protein [Candidatus Saccharimonadales bacterium]
MDVIVGVVLSLIVIAIIILIVLYATGHLSINSPTGPTGPTGYTGPTGHGSAANTGATGPTGIPGIQGNNGMPGATGQMGLIGPRGPMGLIGPPGPTGPSNTLNTFSHFIWVNNTETTSISPGQNIAFNFNFMTNGFVYNTETNQIIINNPGLYLVSFGYANLAPPTTIINPVNIIIVLSVNNNVLPQYTLNQIFSSQMTVNQNATVYIQTSSANTPISLFNASNQTYFFPLQNCISAYITMERVM